MLGLPKKDGLDARLFMSAVRFVFSSWLIFSGEIHGFDIYVAFASVRVFTTGFSFEAG
jgi:hypothetical protein